MRKDTQEVAAWEEVAKEQKRTTSVEAVQDATHCGRGCCSSTRRGRGKIGASEDFTSPHDFTCTFSIFLGVAEGVVEYAVLLVFACSTGDEQL